MSSDLSNRPGCHSGCRNGGGALADGVLYSSIFPEQPDPAGLHGSDGGRSSAVCSRCPERRQSGSDRSGATDTRRPVHRSSSTTGSTTNRTSASTTISPTIALLSRLPTFSWRRRCSGLRQPDRRALPAVEHHAYLDHQQQLGQRVPLQLQPRSAGDISTSRRRPSLVQDSCPPAPSWLDGVTTARCLVSPTARTGNATGIHPAWARPRRLAIHSDFGRIQSRQ